MPMQLEHLAAPADVQKPSQWLILATQLLAVSSPDLVTLIRQEAAENPALEVEEHPHCLRCGRALQGPFCPECQAAPVSPSEDPPARDEVASLPGIPSAHTPAGEAFDAPEHLPAPVSLADVLLQTLQAERPSEDAPIIDYLVGNLDEHGYLGSTVAEAAHALNASPERVQRVLAQLQTLDPPGIGAQDVRECLLLQLRSLEARGQAHPVAFSIVDRFLSHLSRGHYGEIARELGLTRHAVEEAHAFIRERLTPFPAQGHLEGQHGPVREDLRPVVPDVIIRRLEGEPLVYELEVVEEQRFSVRLAPAYVESYQAVSEQRMWSAEERVQIQQALSQARFFLSSLRHRWQTLARITRGLIEQQGTFLEQGAGALLPLTRAELATTLGLHPSTVSRATADKYVLLPSAEVVPFATFFTASVPVKAALREVLEQAQEPLSLPLWAVNRNG